MGLKIRPINYRILRARYVPVIVYFALKTNFGVVIFLLAQIHFHREDSHHFAQVWIL